MYIYSLVAFPSISRYRPFPTVSWAFIINPEEFFTVHLKDTTAALRNQAIIKDKPTMEKNIRYKYFLFYLERSNNTSLVQVGTTYTPRYF